MARAVPRRIQSGDRLSRALAAPPPLGDDTALFLDFDGTLAPLQDDPDSVFLPPGGDEVLLSLAKRLNGALAVISGRDLTDLSRRVPQGLWRFGNHGLRSAAPDNPIEQAVAVAPASLLESVEDITRLHDGVRVEVKGPILAVHYRAAPTVGADLLEALQELIASHDGYSVQHGKYVIEAKPAGANKGRCLEVVMAWPPFKGRVPVVIGDDRTDEDAYEAAARLGGWAVKVGEGETVAQYRFGSQADVMPYLKSMLGES